MNSAQEQVLKDGVLMDEGGKSEKEGADEKRESSLQIQYPRK